MKHHKYYNTIWSERDQEFYWDGTKTGMIIGALGIASAVGLTLVIVDTIKDFKRQINN